MRLDSFLRNSGLVPRRPVAKRVCDSGAVTVDGKPAKPSSEVTVGEQITLATGTRIATYRVLALPQRPVPKTQRDQYTQLISSELRSEDSI